MRWAATRILRTDGIDGVVVDGSQALVQSGSRIDGFAYIYDRWWHLLTASAACSEKWAPFASGVSQPLLDLARATFEPFTLPDAECESAQSSPNELRPRPHESDGYDLTIAAPQPLPPNALSVSVRRPTEGENWTIYPRGNAYAYFTIHGNARSGESIAQGATVDLRCPFVVEPDKTYSITIANLGQPALGPLRGTEHDGILHFELPAFVIPPNGELLGEIDGSPP